MRRIFICYRRNESEHAAGALGRDLRARFGPDKVFRDKEDIAGGDSWRRKVLAEIDHDAVLLVLIGKNWSEQLDENGRRRLDCEDDPIRMEIADGLRDGASVIPLLVESAPMPRADQLPEELRQFAELNALPLRDGDWEHDLSRLHALLESAGFKQLGAESRRRFSASFITTVVLALIMTFGVTGDRSDWDADTYYGFVFTGLLALVASIVARGDHKRRSVQPQWLSKAAVWFSSLALVAAVGILAEAEEQGEFEDIDQRDAPVVDAGAVSGGWIDQFGNRFSLVQTGQDVTGRIFQQGEIVDCSGAVRGKELELTLWRYGVAAGVFHLSLAIDGLSMEGYYYSAQNQSLPLVLKRQ